MLSFIAILPFISPPAWANLLSFSKQMKALPGLFPCIMRTRAPLYFSQISDYII